MAKAHLLSQAVRSTKNVQRRIKLDGSINFKDNQFREIRRILDQHRLDFSDALRIVMLKSGFYADLAGESKPVLVAADKGLLRAAKAEGILVWNPEGDQRSRLGFSVSPTQTRTPAREETSAVCVSWMLMVRMASAAEYVIDFGMMKISNDFVR